MHQTRTTWLKKGILRGIRLAGYEVMKIPSERPGDEYADVTPVATYSPWNMDATFLEAWNAVRASTLLDPLRAFELWQLVAEAQKSDGEILEVGTWRGGSGALLGLRARALKMPCRIFLADTFRGVVKAGPHDPVYVGGEHSDTSRAVVEQLMGRLGLDNVQILEGIFPDETGNAIEGERFRLVHIDVDTYESVRDIVRWADSRMGPGAIYVYDDYGMVSTPGVRRFVDEERLRPDRVVVHNLNGHAVVIRIA